MNEDGVAGIVSRCVVRREPADLVAVLDAADIHLRRQREQPPRYAVEQPLVMEQSGSALAATQGQVSRADVHRAVEPPLQGIQTTGVVDVVVREKDAVDIRDPVPDLAQLGRERRTVPRESGVDERDRPVVDQEPVRRERGDESEVKQPDPLRESSGHTDCWRHRSKTVRLDNRGILPQ